MATTHNENNSAKLEKPFEEQINDLIKLRKLQQDALVKIRASLEKWQSNEIELKAESIKHKA